MKNKLLNVIPTNKKILFAYIIAIPIIVALFFTSATYLVKASFGTWGNTSLIHACKDNRGRIAIVSTTDSCNNNETQLTWIKDVDAGIGLTATRSSDGVTLSLANAVSDGWTSADETWSYASAQSFTVPGDQTAKYKKGTRVKFTQTSVKYGFVISSTYSSPNTTVTLATNTDFTIANAVITANNYSYQDSPQGYPYSFNFTPTVNNGSIGNGTVNASISNKGNKASIDIKWVFGSTSSVSGNITFSGFPAPLNSNEIGQSYFYNNEDNNVVIGTSLMAGGELYPKRPGVTYGTVHSSAPFTWTTSDEMRLHLEYQF
jgi:hypothetical protein